MTTTETDRLIEDYVSRLEMAASGLPRERREELVDEIREHLDAALADVEPDDALEVRNALERLGPPEEIVRAAGEPAALETRTRTPWLEIAALVAMVIPIGGWIAGIVLVIVSRIWSAREKLLGIFLAFVPPLLLFLAFNVGSGGGSSGEGVLIGDDTGASADRKRQRRRRRQRRASRNWHLPLLPLRHPGARGRGVPWMATAPPQPARRPQRYEMKLELPFRARTLLS